MHENILDIDLSLGILVFLKQPAVLINVSIQLSSSFSFLWYFNVTQRCKFGFKYIRKDSSSIHTIPVQYGPKFIPLSKHRDLKIQIQIGGLTCINELLRYNVLSNNTTKAMDEEVGIFISLFSIVQRPNIFLPSLYFHNDFLLNFIF